jgi:isoquinoline 1-oxidoreductase beta subunit
MKLTPPKTVQLKDPKDWKLIGTPVRRLDSPEKITGKAQFGIDVQFEGLRTAVVARPPAFGAKLVKFDGAAAAKVPGVEKVVQTANGVAVIAKHFWAAKLGRDALKIEWAAPEGGGVDSVKQLAEFRTTAQKPGLPVKETGKVDDALAGAKTRLEAEYSVPYLAHAPMEPLNCTVELRGGGAEIWVGSQFQGADQAAAAKTLGLQPAQVKLNTMLAGGGFGRRANPVSDYVVEACEIAKDIKVPVKVVWTREDDIRGGFYRPMVVHRVEVGLDGAGNIAGWNHAIVGASIVAGTPMEPMMVKDGIDPTSTEGVADTPYAIPNHNVMLHTVNSGVPVLWWRSVGHSHTAFVMETMIDDIAAASGKDPLALRRELLVKHPKVLRVLELAAAKAGWGSALASGRARGIAVHESFGSVCAQVAEVSLAGNEIRVHRVVAAFDCGLVVNPLTVEAQLQSAIAFGLSAALYSQVTLKDGRVEQSNFHDYRVLRMNEMPLVEVHLVPGGEKPTGVGEPGTPPVAPAVANALYALTGKRARSLPLASTKWA